MSMVSFQTLCPAVMVNCQGVWWVCIYFQSCMWGFTPFGVSYAFILTTANPRALVWWYVQSVHVQFSSVQYKMVSMHSEKPVCSPSCLSDVSERLHLKQFQFLSDWWLPSLILSLKIVNHLEDCQLLPLSTPLFSSQWSLGIVFFLMSQASQHLASAETTKPLAVVALPTSLSSQSFSSTPTCPEQCMCCHALQCSVAWRSRTQWHWSVSDVSQRQCVRSWKTGQGLIHTVQFALNEASFFTMGSQGTVSNNNNGYLECTGPKCLHCL